MRRGRVVARCAAAGVAVLALLGGCARAVPAASSTAEETQAVMTQTEGPISSHDLDPTPAVSTTGRTTDDEPANPGTAEPVSPETTETAEPDTSDGLDAAPETLTQDGVTYRRVGTVPWFDVALRRDWVAVTTGPETRGACDTSFYRLTLGKEAGQPVTLTSYEYAPAETESPVAGAESSVMVSCPAIGLPPAVATVSWPPGFAEVTEVRDGATGELHPIRSVLVPPLLPAGFTADGFSHEWPQVTDAARPALFWTGGSWSGPAGTLSLAEYATFRYSGQSVEGHAEVRGVPADVVSGIMMTGDRCLSWEDTVTGNSWLCSVGAHGHPPLSAEQLVQLADSLAT